MNKKLLAITALSFAFIGIASAQIDQSKVSLYLPFNESIADQSGKNVTVAQSTVTVGAVTYVDGKFGKAAAFNSSPLVTTGIDFMSDQNFTICAWVNLAVLPSDIGYGQTVIQQKDVTGGAAGRIHLEVLKAGYFGSNTSNVRCDNTPGGIGVAMPINEWHHVASVNDVTNLKRYLYVDGTLVTTIDITTEESNNAELVIGAPKAESGNAMFKQNNAIDDLFITRQAIDAATIASIYANGVSSLLASVNTPKVSALSSYNYKNDQLSLQLNGSLQTANVEVYNVAGQKVFNRLANSSLNTFNIPLSKGIYILKVAAGDYNSTVKFTVN